ncbi:regulator of nonsense transcripts 3A-like [Lethenteron reissneri]|uniref:regulator of nonsense transcripts 3A-like n=1 Tax=Lethenteron reissneri TaxID=7753 RepID=UPI002AB7AE66|nr:regulator of nonsense transcripts 3A-like [Lethenteron reissneri]
MKRGDDARAVLTKEAQSKVVMRRLPPHLTSEQLLEQISPLPDHDYYYFVPADLSLRPHAFCRAYINFSSSEGVLEFRDRFDGYVFINEKVFRGLLKARLRLEHATYRSHAGDAPHIFFERRRGRKSPLCAG